MKGVPGMSEREIIDYAMEYGLEAAANLLLVGPDGFAGDYEEYCGLERSLSEGALA